MRDVVRPKIKKHTDTSRVMSKPRASSKNFDIIEYPGIKASRMFAGSWVMLVVELFSAKSACFRARKALLTAIRRSPISDREVSSFSLELKMDQF